MAITDPLRHDAYIRSAREVLNNRAKRDYYIAMVIAQEDNDEGDVFEWFNSPEANSAGLIENQLVHSFTSLMVTRQEQP